MQNDTFIFGVPDKSNLRVYYLMYKAQTDKGAKHRGAEIGNMQLGLVMVHELSDLLDDSTRTFMVLF